MENNNANNTAAPAQGGVAAFINSFQETPKTEAPKQEDKVVIHDDKLTAKAGEPSKSPTELLADLDEGDGDEAADKTEAPKVDNTKYKLKVDGKEEEVTREDLMKVYEWAIEKEDRVDEPTIGQLKAVYKVVKSTNAKKYQASEETKRAKAALQRLEEDLWGTVEEFTKRKGIDLDAEIEKRLAKTLKLKLMSPEDREAYLKREKDARDLENYRKREEEETNQKKIEELRAKTGKQAEELLADINAAYESDKSLPKNKITGRMFVQLLQTASRMYENRNNPNIPANQKLQQMPKPIDIIHLVKEGWKQHVNSLLSLVPDESLVDSLGEDHLKRINKQTQKMLQPEQTGKIPGVGKNPIGSSKKQPKKTQSAYDFFEEIKRST